VDVHHRVRRRHHREPQHPYINKCEARRAADRIIEAFGTGTVLD